MKIIWFLIISTLVLSIPFVAADSVSFLYDDNGNLLQDVDYQYEYDGLNQLVKVSDLNNIILEEYTYNHNGKRIKKVEYLDSDVRITYYPNKNLVRVVNSSGTYDYIYVYDDNGVLLAKKDYNGDLFYHHPDHLGSTSLVSNNGGFVEKTTYLPFGEVWEGGHDRFTYTGQESDDTGLMYYGARYYSPFLRQFTQPDTVVQDVYNPQNLNRYSYVLNNPYKYVDPDGHFVIPLLYAAGVGIASFAAYTSSYWMPYVGAYFNDQSFSDIKTAYTEPSVVNTLWAGLATWDLATPGIPEGKIAKGGG